MTDRIHHEFSEAGDRLAFCTIINVVEPHVAKFVYDSVSAPNFDAANTQTDRPLYNHLREVIDGYRPHP